MTDHAVCNPASDPVIYPNLMHAASSCGELLMIGEVTLLLDRLTINGDASVTDLEVTLDLGAVGGVQLVSCDSDLRGQRAPLRARRPVSKTRCL
jgi:hypothetical protein